MLSYLSSWRKDRMSNWRSFGEFLNSRRVGLPPGVMGAKRRVFSNVPYFLTNYLMVALALGVLTLLLAPLLAILISLPVVCYWYLFIWRRDAEWTVPVLNRPVGDRERWIPVGVVFALVFLYAASDLIWLLGTTFIFVGLHAVLYKSPEEYETETLFEDPPV